MFDDEAEIEDVLVDVIEDSDFELPDDLAKYLIKKAANVFFGGMVPKEKSEYDRHVADEQSFAYAKEARERDIHQARMQKEQLAIEKLKAEIEALKHPAQVETQATPVVDSQQPVIFGELPSVPQSPFLECPDNPEEFETFLQQIKSYPASIVILGARGGGKSALSYALIEYLKHETGKPAYVLGAPHAKKYLLPQWLQIVDSFDEVKPDSLLLVDEAGIILNSRNSGKKLNRSFVDVNALLRQKGVTMVFVSQTSKTIDVNAFQVGDIVIIWKKPDKMALTFERGFVKESGTQARKLFESLPKDQWKQYSVIVGIDSDSYIVMKNGLPSFWTDDLSRIFGGLPSENRDDEIKKLHAQGMTQIEIAEKLGITQGRVSQVLKQ